MCDVKKTYQDAMDGLPFSDELEAKTLALLKASSAGMTKEEESMKNTILDPQSPKGRAGKGALRFPARRHTAVFGGVLAAAACLLLVMLPMLQNSVDEPATGNGSVVTEYDVSQDEVASSAFLGAEDASEAVAAGSIARMKEVPAEAEVNYDTWTFGGAAMVSEAMEPGSYGEAAFSGLAMYAAKPAWNTEEYSFFEENRFLSTQTSPLSTFAADVDTASYAKLRSAILAGQAVPADSVRIEEMLNYFQYDFAQPEDGEPFGVTTEIAACPWNEDTQLLLVGLQAEEIDAENLPPQNLVFLIDVSGSMDEPNKLPLVKRSFQLLLDQLKPMDTISIVTYASGDRIVLDGVRTGDKAIISEALEKMYAGGGTAGAAGIQTAYQLAEKHFIPGGNNRIILATDGDLNIGISDEGSLTRLVEEKRESGVFLSVLGYGMGNYKDNKLEALANHGNGNYAYIDTIHEARKALVEEIGGTFFTVAKDVKLQVEFNPAKVKGYRLIGYENRTMAAEDFANDAKDGGEVGSGHSVTVLYEIVPIDSKMEVDTVETKYQSAEGVESDEWLTVNVRSKEPEGDVSKLYSYPVTPQPTETISDNMRFASAVAECGMLLRDSEFRGTADYADVLQRLRETESVNGDVYKEEFQYMITLLMRENP